MGGLSTTHYDSATIAISSSADGDVATATSGATVGGRALTATALGPDDGLRIALIEVVSLRSSNNTYTLGVVDNTDSLGDWLGGSSESGFVWRRISQIERFTGGSPTSNHGVSAGDVGMLVYLYVDPASRKIWIAASQRENGRYGDGQFARPDLGTDPTYTVPGSGPLRIALSPARGAGSDTNALRLRSRHSQIPVGIDRLGARPWDSRTITLTGTLDASDVSVGETLRWAWFDHSSPHLITSAPTSVGSTTVLAGTPPTYSIAASTSLEAGGTGMLVVMKSDGTPIDCRAHAAPVTVP
jgi:hypothetical protein